MPTMTLTEFEEQVLEMFRRLESWTSKSVCYLGWIHRNGKELFGNEWGGSIKLSNSGNDYCPTLNRCAGRLLVKGFLQRENSAIAADHGERWGLWSLTPEGREFLGLDPAGSFS